MTLSTPDILAIALAVLLLLGTAGYITREVRRGRPIPVRTDQGLLEMLDRLGPLFVHEMRRFGVTRARARVDRLLAAGYVQLEGAPGGVLVGLTPAGGARARSRA